MKKNLVHDILEKVLQRFSDLRDTNNNYLFLLCRGTSRCSWYDAFN